MISMKTYNKTLQIVLWLFFAAIILLPTLNEHLHFIEENKGNENRTKVQKPNFDSLHLASFVKAFDDYYSDNFNLRQNFISFHNVFEYLVFHISPVPKDVLIGKDGWFYNANCIPGYKGANLFTEKEMLQLKNELTLRTKWATERGVKYYLAIVPNKMSVYPEYLPCSVIKISGSTRYDQIVSLDNYPSINVIDIKKNLLKHKNENRFLFQHTDDHWNDLGAYYGYQEIMNRIHKDFPDLSPFSLNDFEIHEEKRSGNMAMMTSLEKYCPENFVALTEKNKIFAHDGIKRGYKVPKNISDWDYEIVKVNENGKKLKVLIIRDSFTLLLIRYLQEHFRESVFIHDEWKYRMREDLILKEKPDVVINIMVETYAYNILQFPFIWNDNQETKKFITLKAANGKFVCSDQSKNDNLIARSDDGWAWETFEIICLDSIHINLKASTGKFVSANHDMEEVLIANKDEAKEWETFTIIKLDNNMVAFKAFNGKYFSLDEKSRQLFVSANSIGEKEKFELILKDN